MYVFNDNEASQQLKKILSTPEFLKLKEMSWSIGETETVASHRLRYNPSDNSFSFAAHFDYKLHSKQEAELLNKLGFYYKERGYIGLFKNGLTNDEFEKLQGLTSYRLALKGTLYEHNDSSKNLLKNAKPLSKKYSFTIYSDKEESRVNTSVMAKRIALLSFAIAADVVLLPANILWAIDGFDNPFKP